MVSCTSLGGINVRMLGFVIFRSRSWSGLKMYIITWITNPNILTLIPPSEVQETTSFRYFSTTLRNVLFSDILAVCEMPFISGGQKAWFVVFSILKNHYHCYLMLL